jgi:hypothetical protein
MEYLIKIRAFVEKYLKTFTGVVLGAGVLIGAVGEYMTKILEAVSK